MSDHFAHKKSLGQHFLNSDIVPMWLCDAGEVMTGETVLEIGPGTGALTKALLARGARVIALEADERALSVLTDSFAHEIQTGQLKLHHTDVRSFSLTALGLVDHQYKVVANIPYYLSGHLFRTFLESTCQPHTLVFLVQKEVAERIARSKKTSLLSLSIAVYGTPTYICTVKRGHFTPPPRVDSAIIAVTHIHRNHFTHFDSGAFFALLHLGFGAKRKQLLGNLAHIYSRESLLAIFTELHLGPTVRAEDIELPVWLALADKLLMKK